MKMYFIICNNNYPLTPEGLTISRITKILIHESVTRCQLAYFGSSRIGTINLSYLTNTRTPLCYANLVERHLRNKQNVSSDFALKSFENLRSFVLVPVIPKMLANFFYRLRSIQLSYLRYDLISCYVQFILRKSKGSQSFFGTNYVWDE